MTEPTTTLNVAADPTTPPGTEPGPSERAARRAVWRQSLLVAAVAYVLSRLFVLAAASTKPASEVPRPTSALEGILGVLTSWDGLWYLRIVRMGYPRSVPPDITYFEDEARAAFFPLYPLVVRAADRLLPGGDTFASLFVNVVLGAVFVYLVGVLTRRVAGERLAGRAMVLAALFPGSFVLSFAYSEAVMLVLAALTLLWLHEERWVLAGLAAALAGLSRPNGLALAGACAAAAVVALRRSPRDWWALAAPAIAPLGFVGFQLFLWQHTGEAGVWFRVQREAWDEGISFGWTAVRNAVEFLLDPFSSATDAFTVLVLVAMVAMLVLTWRARLPRPWVVYTLLILALMLLPSTVTARPRFLFTAFPLLIGTAVAWPRRTELAQQIWAIGLAACGAGLVAVTALYGLYAAIP